MNRRQLQYNFNLLKKQLNKHGLRVPTIVLGDLKYYYKDFKELNHDLPMYKTNMPAYFKIRFDEDNNIILEYSKISETYVTDKILKSPKYYTLHQIAHWTYLKADYNYKNGFMKRMVTVIDYRDSAYTVMEKVNAALDDMISCWKSVFDIYRSPAYKDWQKATKERLQSIRRINSQYNTVLGGLKNSMQDMYSFNKAINTKV